MELKKGKESSYSTNEGGDKQVQREVNNNRDIEECMLSPSKSSRSEHWNQSQNHSSNLKLTSISKHQ